MCDKNHVIYIYIYKINVMNEFVRIWERKHGIIGGARNGRLRRACRYGLALFQERVYLSVI